MRLGISWQTQFQCDFYLFQPFTYKFHDSICPTAEQFFIAYIYYSFIVNSSLLEPLGCFSFLALVNETMADVAEHVSLNHGVTCHHTLGTCQRDGAWVGLFQLWSFLHMEFHSVGTSV